MYVISYIVFTTYHFDMSVEADNKLHITLYHILYTVLCVFLFRIHVYIYIHTYIHTFLYCIIAIYNLSC